MNIQYRKSEPTAALRRWLFACMDSTDGVTPETSLSFSGAELQLGKAGGAFANFAGTATELSDGLYYYEATAAELDTTGVLAFKVEKSGVRLVNLTPGEVVGAPTEQGIKPWLFTCVDNTDGFTAEPGLTFAASELQLTANGAAFANHAGTVTELSDGVYYYAPTQTEKETPGVLGFKVEKTGVRLGLYSVGQYRQGPYTSVTTTVALVRDRAASLILAITPDLMAGDAFKELRHEYAGNPRTWGQGNQSAALRRFSVRDITENESPIHSGQDVEQRTVVLEVVIIYPQTHRYGDQAALDRDDVIRSDEKQIISAISAPGRGNFGTGTAYNATPFFPRNTETIERDDENGVDFLVLEIPYLYQQAR